MPIGWPQFSVDYSTQLIDSGFDRDGIDNAEYQYALKTLFSFYLSVCSVLKFGFVAESLSFDEK